MRSLVARHTGRAALLGALFAQLPACMPLDEADYTTDGNGDDTAASDSAILGSNGLNPNGWNLNGLHTNGLHTNGLGWNGLHTNGLHTNGVATANIQAWLQGQVGALDVMPYLVACAAPSGTTVTATVNGTTYTWPGVFGFAPGWVNAAPLGTAEQEWVSACLLAHVNLAGKHVLVSFRGPHPGLATSPEERASHNCREAAFMGNIFAGWETDPLPVMQCHEAGALVGTGRACDPAQENGNCATDCFASCDKSSDYFTSCDVKVNGAPRTYTHVITTYLPTDSAQGCLGWGYDITSNNAQFQSLSTHGGQWSWSWGWSLPFSSCSGHCGGYAASGCSCAPDCATNGTCCSDYASLCGTPPPYTGPTSGVSACPTGYTTSTGSLPSTTDAAYFPSAAGFKALTSGTQHATLLGPATGSDFDLSLEALSGTTQWSVVAKSERSSANESMHYFYGKAGRTYRWKVTHASGSGNYTLCTKQP